MEIKLSSSQIKNYLMPIIVLLLILTSKTVYFGVVHGTLFRYIFWISVLITLFFSKFIKSYFFENILISLLLSVILIFSIYMNLSQMNISLINYVLGFIFNIISTSVIVIIFNKEKFSYYYIKILAIIAIISLICFLIANIYPNLAYSLLGSYNWQDRIGYSFFYTWGWYGTIFTRNSGLFWEPGAYQVFLFIALLMLLFNTCGEKLKHKKLYLFLFIITLLTTQSTTAYILLILTIVSLYNRYNAIINSQYKVKGILKNYVFLLVMIIIIIVILSMENITDKFEENSVSFLIRNHDFRISCSIFMQNSLFGVGHTLKKHALLSLSGIVDNSVGLLDMLCTFGIIFGLPYLLFLKRGLDSFFNKNNIYEKFIIYIIFIVFHLTQGFYYLPIFCIFLFKFSSYNNNVKER